MNIKRKKLKNCEYKDNYREDERNRLHWGLQWPITKKLGRIVKEKTKFNKNCRYTLSIIKLTIPYLSFIFNSNILIVASLKDNIGNYCLLVISKFCKKLLKIINNYYL